MMLAARPGSNPPAAPRARPAPDTGPALRVTDGPIASPSLILQHRLIAAYTGEIQPKSSTAGTKLALIILLSLLLWSAIGMVAYAGSAILAAF
jgi:hypothetical protein